MSTNVYIGEVSVNDIAIVLECLDNGTTFLLTPLGACWVVSWALTLLNPGPDWPFEL